VEPDEAEGGPPEDDLEEPTTALLGGVPVAAEGGPPAEEEPTTTFLGDMQEASWALSIAISFLGDIFSVAPMSGIPPIRGRCCRRLEEVDASCQYVHTVLRMVGSRFPLLTWLFLNNG
jgi:hypothetical protein